MIALPFGLIGNAKKERESQQREEARIASIAALERQETQPEDLRLPKSAAKYIWGHFYVQRPAAGFIYLKTNGARMQREARMIASGVDENGDGVLGCFENGQFRVFYADRIRDLTPIENS